MQAANQIDSGTVPDRAPTWDVLRDRAPYDSDVRDDPSGGVVVHRCHPDVEPTDYFAFAYRHETMKGYVTRDMYLFDGPLERGERPTMLGISSWDGAVRSFHVRAGSHEDCGVCQGTADPSDLLREVIDTATEQVGGDHNVAKSGVYGEGRDGAHRAEVYLDSHGMATEGGPYSVDNSTRHWDDHIVAHPYVQMAGAEEVGPGGNVHSPDDTLKITLKTWFPSRGPGCALGENA